MHAYAVCNQEEVSTGHDWLTDSFLQKVPKVFN